jgi:aspartate/methionine/tyrosine aminotransferase
MDTSAPALHDLPGGRLGASVNPLVADTGTPPIPEAQAWVARYDGAYGPLINMSQAVPGYPPHPVFVERLTEAANAVETSKYGIITGDAELRGAYAAHLSGLYGALIEPADTAITAGCNLAYFAAAMLVAKAGDAVLVPVPWYFNHRMTLDMFGVEARPLPCDPARGFVPDPADAERLLDERVKAIVLVTPNNPTGAIYPDETLLAFHELCRRRGIWLIVDETYRDFLPLVARRPHALFADADWRTTLIQLYSFSKSYSIPGYRLGSVVADAPVIAELTKILDCIQICAPRIGQAAVTWALDGLSGWRESNRAEMSRRADAFRRMIAACPGWTPDSMGAYFAYVRHPFPGVSAQAVAEALAVERGVLALPGSYFGEGQDDHLRIAFGNIDRDGIESLAARLSGFSA